MPVSPNAKWFNGLASKVQNVLKDDPFSGHLFIFRGRRGDQIKVLWADSDGLCLFTKRLERGRFVWPVTRRKVTLLRLSYHAS
ncbi:putative transposase [Escherichia coli 2850750]|nr:putative transposase [Escherichia coli 2850750]